MEPMDSEVAGSPSGKEPSPPRSLGARAADLLFAPSASALWMLAAAAVLLLAMLGSRELWSLEGRWGSICQEMLRSGDFFHPYLLGEEYYDKPLLSYWLMAGFAAVLGGLDEWALRLPGALAGLLAVWCTYRIGSRLSGRPVGLLAGWILLTTYFFVFWARTASADMLNVAGATGAVAWSIERRERPGFLTYSVFFAILAITSLMKGPVGAVISILALIPLLLRGGEWRIHLRPSLFLAVIPAAAIYLAPFLASSLWGGGGYEQSGLWMVFRENILRFFRPFDHKDGPFTYFIYLPVYLIPWTIFLPAAIWRAGREWKVLGDGERWAAWASILIFLFLTLSGSRRSYYILPILPFAAVFLAGAILAPGAREVLRRASSAWLALVTALGLLAWLGVAQPIYESYGGLRELSRELQGILEKEAPLSQWDFVIWKGTPKTAFYMSPEKKVVRFGSEKADPKEFLPGLLEKNPKTVIITHRESRGEIERVLPRHRIVEEKRGLPPWMLSEGSKEKLVIVSIPPQR